MKKFMLVALMVVTVAAQAAKPSMRELDARLAASDKEMMLAAMAMVRWDLTDPDSARFRAVAISPGGKAVCGEVNSRNRMGGYDGFRRFIAARDKIAVESDKAPFSATEWVNRCLSDGDPVTYK
jgi:hypothetical protein